MKKSFYYNILIVFTLFASANLYAQSDTLKEHLVLESLLSEGVKTFSVIEIDSSELIKYHGQTTEEVLSRNGGVFVKQYGSGNLDPETGIFTPSGK